MAKRKDLQIFSIAFLDLISGALGAVIILYVAVPKAESVQKLEEKQRVPNASVEIMKEDKQSPQKMKSIEEKIKKLQKMITQAVDSQEESEKENKALKDQNAELKKKVTKQEKVIKKEKRKNNINKETGKNVDVGFKFKGKNIVFIIDVSGSMIMEDRIGQVKAGLKMLITSMGSEFNIDVLQFPNKMSSPQRALWRRLRPMNDRNKTEVYNFLLKLRPFGSTPTRAVLTHALANYSTATDFVVLSDGAPTLHNTKTFENIHSVLTKIRSQNYRKVQINTIGVGSDFLKNKTNTKYRFLKQLAVQNGGFFFGF